MWKPFIPMLLWSLLAAAIATFATSATAQERDVMVQQIGGKLATGLADLNANTFTIPEQVFTRNFLSNFRAADPGFFALSDGNPQLGGAGALPAGSGLFWDFLPMTVDQTVSNLFFWDGLDDDENGLTIDDVDFVRPANVKFVINSPGTGEGFGLAAADATDQLIPGAKIDNTAFDGSLHKHPSLRVESVGTADNPPQGVYLISLQVRMDGLTTSDPFFLAMRTSTIGNDVLLTTETWIENNIDMLTSPPLLAGDYNGDGRVDAADFTVWRDTLGSTVDLRANGDDTGASMGVIDEADFAVWRSNFGSHSGGGAAALALSAGVPEPSSWLVLFTSGLTCLAFRRRLPCECPAN